MENDLYYILYVLKDFIHCLVISAILNHLNYDYNIEPTGPTYWVVDIIHIHLVGHSLYLPGSDDKYHNNCYHSQNRIICTTTYIPFVVINLLLVTVL